MTYDRQIGVVYFTSDVIESGEAAEIFSLMAFVPLQVTYEPWLFRYKYVGNSHLFRAIEVGSKAPEYEIFVSADINENGEIIGPLKVEAREI